eukprot:5273068-Amphidinium_carterae.1
MSASHMKDIRIGAHKALGSSPLELMAYGGPANDPQVTADLPLPLERLCPRTWTWPHTTVTLTFRC